MASHSTRAREDRSTTGPRRMALSDPERAQVSARAEGESKGQTPGPVFAPRFVYVLECADGSNCVGATCDLLGRERAHNDGHGSEYTAARRPVRLVYSERLESWPAARKREAQLKRWSHAKKKALVASDAELLHRLAKRKR